MTNPYITSDNLIGTRAASLRLGVHENTIRNWAAKGIVPLAQVLPEGFKRYDARQIERLRNGKDPQFAECLSCQRMTTWLEADARMFNTGSCACGGALG